MDHLGTVGVFQGPGDVAHDVDRVAQGKRSLTREADAKRFALDVRHYIVERLFDFARGKDGNDVRVTEIGRDVDLTQE